MVIAMQIELTLNEIRAVAGYAAACARPALVIFENEFPDDNHPSIAIEVAQDFAEGAARTRPYEIMRGPLKGLLTKPVLQKNRGE